MSATRTIRLPKGFVALVSPEDFDQLNQFTWYVRFCGNTRSWYTYRTVRQNGKTKSIQMSRQILGLEHGDPRQADHSNHNTLDNTRANLRIATRKQNCQNRRRRSDNRSGYKGVSWSRRFGAWVTQLWIEGTNKRIGVFDNPESAARAYDAAAREHFGPFALTNFPAPRHVEMTLAEAA